MNRQFDTETALAELELLQKRYDSFKEKIRQKCPECGQVHFKNLFMNAASAIVILNDNGVIEQINEAFSHITGYASSCVITRPLSSLLASDDQDSAREIDNLFSNPGVCSRFKHPLTCNDESLIWIEMTVSSLTEESGCRYTICIFNDITHDYEQMVQQEQTIHELQEVKELQEENSAQLALLLHELDEKNLELEKEISERKKAERMLRESEERFKSLSITDQLTGLYNRRHLHDVFEDEIKRSKRYGRPLSILLMDVDDFKDFNDTYGHLAGDVVLSRLGQIIIDSIRDTDKAFRYGGEEFLVLLPETTGDEAITTAERVRKSMEDEVFFPTKGKKVIKTLSTGIAEYIQGEPSNDFLKRADDNMYKAKINGKNRIFYFGEDCIYFAS